MEATMAEGLRHALEALAYALEEGELDAGGAACSLRMLARLLADGDEGDA